MNAAPLILLCCLPAAARAAIHTNNAEELRAAVARGNGVVELPRGTTVIHRPLEIPRGSHVLEIRAHSQGSTLAMAPDFRGRAAIVADGATEIRLAGFLVAGNRRGPEARLGLPADGTPFASFYQENGILITHGKDIRIEGVTLRNIRSFPVLVAASETVHIRSATIEDSGTLNARGRNNTTGGVLFEEGTKDFSVQDCTFRNIAGNAIWTHSYQSSPRNADGVVSGNTIRRAARDAIQVGHATRVRVENNRGEEIGYPVAWVDVEGGGIPVALDTAGNVDASSYTGNTFHDVNGQCIDLDGFHDGSVTGNTCINRLPLGSYPNLHYGVVFGNNNPGMTSTNVLVSGNLVEGFAYGGLFLIGTHHRILSNRFLDLNLAHCTGKMTPPRCSYAPDEPGMLRSGIYLGRAGGRPAVTRDNQIRGNTVTGFGMDRWCIGAAPGVDRARNTIAGNRCRESPPR